MIIFLSGSNGYLPWCHVFLLSSFLYALWIVLDYVMSFFPITFCLSLSSYPPPPPNISSSPRVYPVLAWRVKLRLLLFALYASFAGLMLERTQQHYSCTLEKWNGICICGDFAIGGNGWLIVCTHLTSRLNTGTWFWPPPTLHFLLLGCLEQLTYFLTVSHFESADFNLTWAENEQLLCVRNSGGGGDNNISTSLVQILQYKFTRVFSVMHPHLYLHVSTRTTT